jgi:hypothetical protein
LTAELRNSVKLFDARLAVLATMLEKRSTGQKQRLIISLTLSGVVGSDGNLDGARLVNVNLEGEKSCSLHLHSILGHLQGSASRLPRLPSLQAQARLQASLQTSRPTQGISSAWMMLVAQVLHHRILEALSG